MHFLIHSRYFYALSLCMSLIYFMHETIDSMHLSCLKATGAQSHYMMPSSKTHKASMQSIRMLSNQQNKHQAVLQYARQQDKRAV